MQRLGPFAALMAGTAILVGGFTAAPNTAPSKADQARYDGLRERIERNERESRAAPSAPGRTAPDTSGVIQIQQPPQANGGFTEGGAKPPAQPVTWTQAKAGPPQILPYPLTPYYPPPPPCPYGAPTKFANLQKIFAQVSWHVCVRDVGKKGLWVGPVDIRRTTGGPWMRVLYEAGLADIFVPYDHINFRPYDMLFTTMLDKLQQQDAPNGTLVQLQNETPNTPTVMAETRERGIGWLCKGDTTPTARGQDFILWGITDGGNYDNIIEFGFHDDGTMTYRVGNTGYNSPDNPHEPHAHIPLWRVDVDLNGWPSDTASWLRHIEPVPGNPFPADETQTPLNVESAMGWDEHQFSALLIEDSSTNAFGHKLGYAFSAMQPGLSRTFQPNEQWTQNDVYVVQFNANEQGWMQQIVTPDSYLLPSLNGQSVNNQDLVVWVKTSALHVPGDEDKSNADLVGGGTTGITLTHWSGFKAEPHNLFNANPLGGPVKCGN